MPLEKGYYVLDNIVTSAEAVSEAAAAHCLIAYVNEEEVKKHLPVDFAQQVRKYVKEEIARPELPVYAFVPVAFAWMEEEGVAVVVKNYLTGSDAFKSVLLERRKRGK